jgi:hypothetical protein
MATALDLDAERVAMRSEQPLRARERAERVLGRALDQRDVQLLVGQVRQARQHPVLGAKEMALEVAHAIAPCRDHPRGDPIGDLRTPPQVPRLR